MEETINSEVSKRLTTWLPADVFFAFTEFCKTNAMTGLQKFDFGVGLRILLMKAQYADMLYELDQRIRTLESNTQEPKQEIPAGYFEVKTLGKLNKENKNG
jgi:hypothetical protein